MPKRSDPHPERVTVIRYQLPDGTRCAKSTPGAIRIRTLSDSYYLRLPPRATGGKRERITLDTADEAVAWKKINAILKERREEDLGIVDVSSRQAARPIVEHLEEWLASVAQAGADHKRVGMLRSRLGNLVTLAGWRLIGDVKKSSLTGALQRLRDGAVAGRGSAGRDRGASDQTCNHYLSHARQFCRWLKDEGRLGLDPLAGMKGVSVETDRRHDRRIPDELEVRVFFDHLDGRQSVQPRERNGMSGPRRALGYQVAMCAGLRAGELRRLTAGSFDLAAGEVRITARSDKARKRRKMTLPYWLSGKVAAWIAAGGGLWERFPAGAPGRILQADLALARAGWIADSSDDDEEELSRREQSTVCVYEIQTEDGPTYFDFHSLRHWFVTQIAGTEGISPSTLQALSRHADPRLTLGTYGRAKAGQMRDVVEQLPRLDHPESK